MAPPTGAMLPANPAAASVVGWPSASRAQSDGIGVPLAAASMTFTRAVALVARSMTTGRASSRGAARAIGLVPNKGTFPPQGAIEGEALAKPRPTNPCLGDQVDEPAEDSGGIGVGDGQRSNPETFGDRAQSVESSQEGRVGESEVGVDPDGRPDLLHDARVGESVHLSDSQVLAVRGQVREADIADPFGFGVGDGASRRTSLKVVGAGARQCSVGELIDLVESQNRHGCDARSGRPW